MRPTSWKKEEAQRHSPGPTSVQLRAKDPEGPANPNGWPNGWGNPANSISVTRQRTSNSTHHSWWRIQATSCTTSNNVISAWITPTLSRRDGIPSASRCQGPSKMIKQQISDEDSSCHIRPTTQTPALQSRPLPPKISNAHQLLYSKLNSIFSASEDHPDSFLQFSYY